MWQFGLSAAGMFRQLGARRYRVALSTGFLLRSLEQMVMAAKTRPE